MRTLVGSPEPTQPSVIVTTGFTATVSPATTMTAWTDWCPKCGVPFGTHNISCPTLVNLIDRV